MTSKEAFERTRNHLRFYLEQYEPEAIRLFEDYEKIIFNDLEDYEELLKIMGTPIEKIMKDLKELEKYRNEKYKHWNIFFNGANLEYLLYLEQKGKESFMTSISEELYSKIHKHFLE